MLLRGAPKGIVPRTHALAALLSRWLNHCQSLRVAMEEKLPSYENPPIAEVAIGCRFSRLESFKIPHFGLFWQKVKESFPTAEHAGPILPERGLGAADVVGGLPLPRVWLISKSQDRLIQIQVDRLHFNWRRIDPKSEYPRFDVLAAEFERIFNEFERLADELGIGAVEPDQYELSYINHLRKGIDWNEISDLPEIFPNFVWNQTPKAFLPFPQRVAWDLGFPIPNEMGFLHVKLSMGSLQLDPSTPALIMELTVRGAPKDKNADARKSWFGIAHEWIVRGFADLVTENTQTRVWRKR